MTLIPLRDLLGPSPLAGRIHGERDLSKIEDALRAGESDVVILDFDKVELITSSYFLAAFWPLWGDRGGQEWFPILANVGEQVLEDIVLPVRQGRGAIWTATWSAGSLREPRVEGDLETELRLTLRLALEQGEVTASSLHEQDASVGKTAWNNRLADLHRLRLLRRRKEGRQLIYVVPWGV